VVFVITNRDFIQSNKKTLLLLLRTSHPTPLIIILRIGGCTWLIYTEIFVVSRRGGIACIAYRGIGSDSGFVRSPGTEAIAARNMAKGLTVVGNLAFGAFVNTVEALFTTRPAHNKSHK